MMIVSAKIKSLIHRYLEGDQLITKGEVLYARSKNRGGLVRLPLETGDLIIVKMWRIRNLKERIKSVAYFSNGWQEWRMHRLIHRAGVPVPLPLGFYRLALPKGELYEAMAIEDLGETERGLPYLKKLIAAKEESEIKAFEERLIDITFEIVGMGVVDIDHSLNNFLVDTNGRLLRIDFECAQRYWSDMMSREKFAEMIARLLVNHVFAVQPEVSRTERFVRRLYDRMDIGHRVRSLVISKVTESLEIQYRKIGVALVVKLPD